MTRIQLLENALADVMTYTKTDSWRPGLMDLWVYDRLISMHESDYEDPEPQWLWRKKPDEIMQIIIDSGPIFDMEYGWEDFDESVREYLDSHEFIIDAMEASDEEYKNNLEENK